MPDYHPDHLCSRCGRPYEEHAGRHNRWVPKGTCPSGPFPKWPTTIRDVRRLAGEEFDRRVERFWKASRTTFQPRR